jgi:hypothetical protein
LLHFGSGVAMLFLLSETLREHPSPMSRLSGRELAVMEAVGRVAKFHRQSAHRLRMSRGESGRPFEGGSFRQLLTDPNRPLCRKLAVLESGQLTLTKFLTTTATPQVADLVFAIDLADDEVVWTASTVLLTVGINTR